MTDILETAVVLTGLLTVNITLFHVGKIDISNMFNRANINIHLNLHNHFHGDIAMEKVVELNREQSGMLDKACGDAIKTLQGSQTGTPVATESNET